ncbi:restriction endonuclease subunit S [Thiobacter aerophilum]|uniref:Restriction endonuclease subunit S n=1 Tax=Thiobacter aerophilum TaxID=3121275 RepID=A0ABV0EFY5_9BURK
MAGEWPETPLGELVQNFDSRRVPLSNREREKRRGDYPYYGATGIMDYVDGFLFQGLHLFLAEDGSVARPDGKPFLQLVDGRFWVNNHAHVLKVATDEDTKFLYYALSTVAIGPTKKGPSCSMAGRDFIPAAKRPNARAAACSAARQGMA